MKHCFWNNCSFKEAEVSLTKPGLARPVAVLGAGSVGSHSLVLPHLAQLEKIINNSALQDLVSPTMLRSPALVPDAGGTTN